MKKLSPKQKAIAAKAPPPDKIDAKDFAVLKAEKAKGRGMGLQDEKIKPGKVMKAKTGKQIVKEFSASLKGIDESFKSKVHPMKKQRLLDRSTVMTKAKPGKVIKARDGKAIKADPTKTITDKGQFVKRRMKLAGSKLPGRIGTALGIASMMVPAAYAAAKQYKDYKSAKNRDKAKVKNKMVGGMAKKYSVGGGADMGKKNKKSKSGSSVKDIFKSYGKYDGKPIELSKGGGADTGTMGERRSRIGVAMNKLSRTRKVGDRVTKKDLDFIKEAIQGKMGGGMMQKPMGYKSGTMVKARGCKLGRTRPTKIT